jgi:hypothetical protein
MAYHCAVCSDSIQNGQRERKETPINITLNVHESCEAPVEAALSEYQDRTHNRGIDSQNPASVAPREIADKRRELWTSIARGYGVDPMPQAP